MKLKGKLAVAGLLVLMELFALVSPAAADSNRYQLGCRPSPQDVLQRHYDAGYVNSISLNASSAAAVDWSAGMPRPGDQGQQGSCVAWSTGYNYKSYQEQLERQWGLDTNSHLFSPAYIYNQINGGRDAGASIADALNLLVNQGCDTLDDMPYNDRDYRTQPTQAQRQRAAQFKALKWTPLFRGTANISAMKAALADGPIVAGTDVYWSAGWQTTGNISQSDVSGSSAGGHAICLVGYDDNHQTKDGPGAFKFINSWGTRWGSYGGYGWVSYTYAQKHIFEAEVMYDQVAPNNNTFSVSGKVSDQNQQPVSGVAITFAAVNGSGTPPAAVTTDSGGNWSQSGFASGATYRATPSKTGYTFTPASQNFDSTQTGAINFTASAPAATISVTAPADGENWQTGSTHTISWSYTGNPGSSVKMELLKSGAVVNTISSSAPIGGNGAGSYNWTVPSGLAAGSGYQVRVTSTSVPACSGASGSFTISAPAPAATISVTAPAAGASWTVGTTQAIRWTYTGNPGSTVRIELLKGGSLSSTIISSAPIGGNGAGSYNWTVPSGLAAGSGYQVRVTSTASQAITSTSASFTVNGNAPNASTITISSPRGGERWNKGQYNSISWKYTGNPGSTVKIELLKSGTLYKTITNSASIGINGAGYYSWHVSIFQAGGSGFQVRITSNSNPGITSTSPGYFSIGY